MPDRPTRVTTSREKGPGGRDAATGSTGRDPADDRVTGPDLAMSESLLVVLRGIGAVMFLTTRRVIVARDGIERRPRTGVTAFPLYTIRHLHLELGSGPSGRIAVSTAAGHEAVSMFFDARSYDRAHDLIDAARPLIARQRRSPGARPARLSNGPARSGSNSPT